LSSIGGISVLQRFAYQGLVVVGLVAEVVVVSVVGLVVYVVSVYCVNSVSNWGEGGAPTVRRTTPALGTGACPVALGYGIDPVAPPTGIGPAALINCPPC